MSTRSAPTEGGRLGELPRELQLEIFERLDYDAAINLAATNQYHRQTIDPLTLVPKERKIAFLREAEHFPQHQSHWERMKAVRIFPDSEVPSFPHPDAFAFLDDDVRPGFACVECFRIRKWYKFILTNISPPLGKPYSLAAANRINYIPARLCKDCAAIPKIFSHGGAARVSPICHCSPEWEIWNCDLCWENMRGNPMRKMRDVHGCLVCQICVHMTADMLDCPQCGRQLSSGRGRIIRHGLRSLGR